MSVKWIFFGYLYLFCYNDRGATLTGNTTVPLKLFSFGGGDIILLKKIVLSKITPHGGGDDGRHARRARDVHDGDVRDAPRSLRASR